MIFPTVLNPHDSVHTQPPFNELKIFLDAHSVSHVVIICML